MPTVIERAAASLFSTAAFRPVAAGRSTSRADATVATLKKGLDIQSASNATIVRAAYDLVSRNYRSEYFYKNLITSSVFVGRHRASNCALLNEFRIGTSVADCVLVNGKGVVYEIKTEFDSPDKLETQLGNYYKAFPYVNVVVHASDAPRYSERLEGTPAGVLAVGRSGQLSVKKRAQAHTADFDLTTMFKAMRVGEVTSILRRWFGVAPDVPNGLRYAEFLNLAEGIPVLSFQSEMQRVLKMRALGNSRKLLFDDELRPLRAMVAQLDPSTKEQENLMSWLESKGA